MFVLTGAGCSTDSGIPDYRDENGLWKTKEPMRYQTFVGSELARKRYWARAMVGWARVRAASPNDAHQALAVLEHRSKVDCLVTQNVDGLHERAGSRRFIDLHGRLDRVRCLGCEARSSRDEMQERLHEANPDWSFAPHRDGEAIPAPDGDAHLEGDFARFELPTCRACGGVLKPDVVFFGESVPRPRLDAAMTAVDEADLFFVVGSSMMVWSGYRFFRRARERGIPTAAVNLGRTRADDELDYKIAEPCGAVLRRLTTSSGS